MPPIDEAPATPSPRCPELAQAIADDVLELHYQPVISLAHMTMVGLEALVRWPHPERGLLVAAAFVPVAERCGLIGELDRWVLDRACRDLAAWQEDVLVGPEFHVSVNMSGSELDDGSLVRQVGDAIERHGIDPRALVIEITETVAIERPEVATANAQGIRALGALVALDDFGTHHSGLTRLLDLEVDILKVDHHMVAAAGTRHGRSILRMIAELGHEFGAWLIAEGIETTETATTMAELGYHAGQGFLWSPALDLPAVERLLLTGTWPEGCGV